jgi:hypothetical protein
MAADAAALEGLNYCLQGIVKSFVRLLPVLPLVGAPAR